MCQICGWLFAHILSFNLYNYPARYYYFTFIGKEIRTQGAQGHTKVNDTI